MRDRAQLPRRARGRRRLPFANELLGAGLVGIGLVALATLGLTLVGALIALVVAVLL